MNRLQNRPPNFIGKNGKLFLIRCFICQPDYGRENYTMAVVSGRCAWCGHDANKLEDKQDE